jgi:hypothetical protein
MDLLCESLEPDKATLAAPLSREVGEGLPKVREFWWEHSLGPYREMGAEFIRLAARSLIKGSLRSELSHNFRTPHLRGSLDAKLLFRFETRLTEHGAERLEVVRH